MISIEGTSAGMPTNVWIDHGELFSAMAVCPGADDPAFDGMIDIKKGADNVTISYNYMHDHHKITTSGINVRTGAYALVEANYTDWTTTMAFPMPLGYSYTPDPFHP